MTVVVEAAGLTFETRPDLLDQIVVDEVVRDNAYRLDSTVAGQIVVDVGAHIGVFSAYAAHLGAAYVIAVEPEPSNLALLRTNTARWPQVEIVPKALGAWPQRVAGVSGSAHTGHAVDGPLVDAVDLGELFDDLRLDRVNLLKMDCEGCEFTTLAVCPFEVLDRIDRIVMETHGPVLHPWLDRTRVGALVEHLLYTHDVKATGVPDRWGMLYATRRA